MRKLAIARSVLARPRYVALLSASAFAAYATQSMSAEPVPSVMNRQMLHALNRDVGIPESGVQGYLALEKELAGNADRARKVLGNAYGGVWLERDSNGQFQMVIGSTQPLAGKQLASSIGKVRPVKYSLKALDAAKTSLDQRIKGRRVGLEIHSWAVDVRNNSVEISVDPDAMEQAVSFVAATNVDPGIVRIVPSKLRPQTAYDIRGGDQYTYPGSWCSIGFSVTRGGETGFATAGHCGKAGTAVSGTNGIPIGSVAASVFPGNDIGWVRNTNGAQWAVRPLVNNYANGVINVTGGMEGPVGSVICRSGARTGYRCGVITAKNITVNYPNGPVYGLNQSSACLGGGDSGGAHLTPGGEAQGVASGGQLNPSTNENCSIASPVSYYQPLQPILNAYGLRLQTASSCGRMNPGLLPTGGAIYSCNRKFMFVIQGDGNLVHYRVVAEPGKPAGALWANHRYGSNHFLQMQDDGNLVVYNGAGQAVWYTGTNGRPGASLFVQDDGNVVLYSHQAQALWNTQTFGR